MLLLLFHFISFSWLHTYNGMFTQCLRSSSAVSFDPICLHALAARLSLALFSLVLFHFTYLTLPSSHSDVAFLFSIYICAVARWCVGFFRRCVSFFSLLLLVVHIFFCSFVRFVRAWVANIVISVVVASYFVFFSLVVVLFFSFRLAGESYFHYKHIKYFFIENMW